MRGGNHGRWALSGALLVFLLGCCGSRKRVEVAVYRPVKQEIPLPKSADPTMPIFYLAPQRQYEVSGYLQVCDRDEEKVDRELRILGRQMGGDAVFVLDKKARHGLRGSVQSFPTPITTSASTPPPHPSAQEKKEYREQQRRDFESRVTNPPPPPTPPDIVWRDEVFRYEVYAELIRFK